MGAWSSYEKLRIIHTEPSKSHTPCGEDRIQFSGSRSLWAGAGPIVSAGQPRTTGRALCESKFHKFRKPFLIDDPPKPGSGRVKFVGPVGIRKDLAAVDDHD